MKSSKRASASVAPGRTTNGATNADSCLSASRAHSRVEAARSTNSAATETTLLVKRVEP
jgi:hypothetical protein